MLQDWNDGAIKYFTQPPREAAEVTIVSELAAEFDRAQAPRVELTASAETKPFVFAPADPRGAAGAGGAVLARPDAAGVAAASIGGGFGGGFGGGLGAKGGSAGAVAAMAKAGPTEEMETEGGAEGGEGEGLAAKARRQQKEKKIPRKQMLKARLARQQDLSDEADRFNPQANADPNPTPTPTPAPTLTLILTLTLVLTLTLTLTPTRTLATGEPRDQEAAEDRAEEGAAQRLVAHARGDRGDPGPLRPLPTSRAIRTRRAGGAETR